MSSLQFTTITGRTINPDKKTTPIGQRFR